MLAGFMKPGGVLVLKSDVKEYLEFLVQGVDGSGLFDPIRTEVPEIPWTNREVRLRANGFPVFEAAFTKA
jgi:tRNA G46 methylase TrmB